jgi:hypothetical protein
MRVTLLEYINDLPPGVERDALINAYALEKQDGSKTMERRRGHKDRISMSLETVENYENGAIKELAARIRTGKIKPFRVAETLSVAAVVDGPRIKHVQIRARQGGTTQVLEDDANPTNYVSASCLLYVIPETLRVDTLIMMVQFVPERPRYVWVVSHRLVDVWRLPQGIGRQQLTLEEDQVAKAYWTNAQHGRAYGIYWHG